MDKLIHIDIHHLFSERVMNPKGESGKEFKDIVMLAIKQSSKNADIEALKKTLKISGCFDEAIDGKTDLILNEDNHKYIVDCFKKANEWVNTEQVARLVVEVEEKVRTANEGPDTKV